MLGFSKKFAVVLFVAFIFALGFRDVLTFFKIIFAYAIIIIIWNLLTKRKK